MSCLLGSQVSQATVIWTEAATKISKLEKERAVNIQQCSADSAVWGLLTLSNRLTFQIFAVLSGYKCGRSEPRASPAKPCIAISSHAQKLDPTTSAS